MDKSEDKRLNQDSGQDSGQDAEGDGCNTPANDESAAANAGPKTPAADGAPESAASNDAMKDLPAVDAPSLAAAETVNESDDEAVGDGASPRTKAITAAEPQWLDELPHRSGAAAAAAPQPRSFRFALLAAAIAFAAALGSFAGALTAYDMGRHSAVVAGAKTTDSRALQQALRTQGAELAALKASLDGAKSSAGTQFAKITERFNTLERAQSEPAAKIARIADAVERLEKRTAAVPETTGSITASPPPTAPPPASAAAPILDDWVVQDVRNGRALIENRYGRVFVVGSGGLLPGLGRVEAVRRQDGRWVVVTANGLITSPR